MVTEVEAKTKWCPFARTLGSSEYLIRQGDDPIPVSASINREPGDYDRDGNETVELSGRHRCIGSACMAWRVLHKETQREDHSGARDVMNAEAMRTGRHVRREGGPGCLGRLVLDAVGYCGLAGAPHA